ncbi:MAG: 1-(5-phosphoribosyl)-5-[(5-phosphoribosylamino)methylideneamino]imidazole-4-carboxamide isomerase [Alphaproteobacteria bacterium]|nr:1-(5-phosphoribosyl)-5-[(5-phosphoribosylamino)methylideneamino]imidazole-4-carboxamide isomerase [Alphaproteobacteria bacterium]
MIVFPAIDLKDGRCVRLRQGAMDDATIYNDDPAAQARTFEAAGARWLHVVDLDGAVSGLPKNASAVSAILKAVAMPVQLGGGIRDRARIEAWLEAGVRRVVLGTAAIANPELVREAARAHPGRIVVGIDARKGKVAVDGWTRATETTARELADALAGAGVAAIVYTDIDRDGVLGGPNIEATVALAKGLPVPVIASGGVSTIDDITALRAHEKDGIAGVIVGRAIYDGRVDLKRALALAA